MADACSLDDFKAVLLLLADYPQNPTMAGVCHVCTLCVCVQMVLTSRPSLGRWSKWSDYSNDRHTHLSRTSALLPALLDTQPQKHHWDLLSWREQGNHIMMCISLMLLQGTVSFLFCDVMHICEYGSWMLTPQTPYKEIAYVEVTLLNPKDCPL